MSAKTLPLLGGAKVPVIGLGTFSSTDSKEGVGKAVLEALKAGYRSVDCAEMYGNEREIGDAIREFLATGAAKREDLFITSKVWNTNHAPEHVAEACRRTLDNLQLDYLDLYLVHWPMAWEHGGRMMPTESNGKAFKMAKVPLHVTWAAMERLVDEGKVRHIGVSNYTELLLGDLLCYARIPPVCNQIELHPYLQQKNLVRMCQSQGILVSAYSPLGQPTPGRAVNLLEDPVLQQIAKAKGITSSAVILAWNVARGIKVLPKSSNPERLRQNLAACSEVVLSDEEMKAIEALDCYKRFVGMRGTFGGAHVFERATGAGRLPGTSAL